MSDRARAQQPSAEDRLPTPPVPDTIWRILLDPETANRPPGFAGKLYEWRPDLREIPFTWKAGEMNEGPVE
jgi:hypothetical protein